MTLFKLVDGEPVPLTAEELAQRELDAASQAPAPILPVTRAQAKIALSRAGLLAPVKAAVASAGEETQIWFDEAAMWQRDNPHVITLAGALGLSSDQVDGLFRAAAAIEA